MADNPAKGTGFGALPPDVAEARRVERAERQAREAREADERRQGIRRYSLAVSGALFMAAGLYFLLVNPSESSVEGIGRIANLHRLTLGETFTITGAILSGFAWRPKA